MKNLTVGNLKAGFSEVLKDVESGKEIVISYGKSKRKIAVIIPFAKYQKNLPRKLGILAGKATVKIEADFKMTDEEFLQS